MRPARLCVLAVSFVLGCTASVGGTGSAPGGNTDPGSDPEGYVGRHRLEFLNGPGIPVSRGMQSTLEVLYVDDANVATPGATVSFEIRGDALGSVLDSRAAQTGDDGRAGIKVRAGQEDGTFEVVARAPDADQLVFEVTITEKGAGDLRVSMTYDGSRRLRGADLYLYQDGDCERFEPDAPAPADLLQTTSSIRDDAVFDGMPSSTEWTALVLALSETGHVTAWGCAGPADIVGGGEVALDVPLTDVPIHAEGTWQLESHFDVGESLPSGVDSLFDAMAEMTDDPHDPATYFLDLLGDQIDDGALRFAYQAARAITGFDASLNEVLLDLAPNFVWDALDAGGDLGRALQDMQIDSVLTVDEPDADGNIEATHQLVDLVLTLDGRTHRFSIANDVGVHNATARNVPITLVDERTLQIGQHAVGFGVGTLVRFALNEIVLPRFDHSPHSLAEFLQGLVDCRDVGAWLADWVGFGSRSTWEPVCELGVGMMGTYLEVRLLDINEQYDDMTLAGQASAEDADRNMTIDRLEDGDWNAHWTGPAGQIPLEGTFEGDN